MTLSGLINGSRVFDKGKRKLIRSRTYYSFPHGAPRLPSPVIIQASRVLQAEGCLNGTIPTLFPQSYSRCQSSARGSSSKQASTVMPGCHWLIVKTKPKHRPPGPAEEQRRLTCKLSRLNRQNNRHTVRH